MIVPVYCRDCDGTVLNVLGVAERGSRLVEDGGWDPAGLGPHFVLFDCAEHDGYPVVLSKRGEARVEEERCWNDFADQWGRTIKLSDYWMSGFVQEPVQVLAVHDTARTLDAGPGGQ